MKPGIVPNSVVALKDHFC